MDFNADVGEGIGNESQLLPYLTSCNIACGGHAGSESEMKRVIDLAIEHQVKIGAHPSFPDKINFGRIVMKMDSKELFNTILEQVIMLKNSIEQKGAQLTYIKPHGALYHQANSDSATANILIDVLKTVNPQMALMGLPNSALHLLSKKNNITYLREAFADRRYTDEGTLVDRKMDNAVITQNKEVKEHVALIIKHRQIKSVSGNLLPLEVESLCFHGDTPNAVELIKMCSLLKKETSS